MAARLRNVDTAVRATLGWLDERGLEAGHIRRESDVGTPTHPLMRARLRNLIAGWIRPMVYLGHNGVTMAGGVLTTSAAVTLVAFWLLEFTSPRAELLHPYAGILLFLILPGIFLVGLLMIPAGILWRRRRLYRLGRLPVEYPKIDLGSPPLQRGILIVGALTFLNVIILAVASYEGVGYMDSQKFCGQTCHTVMAPEFTAYQNSPHSRVECVDCHIGPGASWFVRSKLSGVRQVFAVAFRTYDRPIPSPVHELRPARETCEQCHWPQKFSGDRLVIRREFLDDEKNSRTTTVLVLKLGGRTFRGSEGIHGRHLDDRSRIEYVSTDGHRQVISRVSYRDDAGRTVEYRATDSKVTPLQPTAGERRLMDCVDCHNRPTHAFELPGHAVDRALAEGRIATDLPFVKKKAVEALKVSYPSRAVAVRDIAAVLHAFYRTQYPDVERSRAAALESAIREVQAIYLRNVFPDMRVTWGTYPNNIGHDDSPGCFRCHDGNHVSADGKVISSDCDTCHVILAQEETNPKILAELGIP